LDGEDGRRLSLAIDDSWSRSLRRVRQKKIIKKKKPLDGEDGWRPSRALDDSWSRSLRRVGQKKIQNVLMVLVCLRECMDVWKKKCMDADGCVFFRGKMMISKKTRMIYSPFPRRCDSKCSSKRKSKSSMINVHISFQMSRSKRDQKETWDDH